MYIKLYVAYTYGRIDNRHTERSEMSSMTDDRNTPSEFSYIEKDVTPWERVGHRLTADGQFILVVSF